MIFEVEEIQLVYEQYGSDSKNALLFSLTNKKKAPIKVKRKRQFGESKKL
jgi:hypothetical protein